MRNVRIDTIGQLRCWNCGMNSFKRKRTMRAKVIGTATVGLGALVTKKKAQCEACNEYNDLGNAKPYKGPASKRLGKKYSTLTNMHGAAVAETDTPLDDDLEPIAPAPASVAPAGPTPSPPAPAPTLMPPAPGTAAGWLPDPSGRAEQRYWDGGRWTEHVHANGEQGVDPV